MRVPTGSICGVISTAALRSKRMTEPSARLMSLAMRTTTAFITTPLAGSDDGSGGAHRQGNQARRRFRHPLRPQRGGADHPADGARGNPHLRAGAARIARQESHEDHLARPGGAVMAAKIKKGDKVIVLAGRDKGRSGEVIEVRPADDRALVRGVNMVKRHQRQTAQQEGGIISKESTIHLSNLALADPKDGKPTRVGFKFVGEGDARKKVRVAKRSGVEIDG